MGKHARTPAPPRVQAAVERRRSNAAGKHRDKRSRRRRTRERALDAALQDQGREDA